MIYFTVYNEERHVSFTVPFTQASSESELEYLKSVVFDMIERFVRDTELIKGDRYQEHKLIFRFRKT